MKDISQLILKSRMLARPYAHLTEWLVCLMYGFALRVLLARCLPYGLKKRKKIRGMNRIRLGMRLGFRVLTNHIKDSSVKPLFLVDILWDFGIYEVEPALLELLPVKIAARLYRQRNDNYIWWWLWYQSASPYIIRLSYVIYGRLETLRRVKQFFAYNIGRQPSRWY